jgi:hemolysin III
MASSAALDVLERPTWRGHLHLIAFLLAIPAGVVLIARAEGTAATVAASVYVASLLLVFGTSATYHRFAIAPRTRAIMQRLDHAMIYLLITGTYVPMCIVALPPAWGIPLLAVVGACAVLGMVLKLVAFHRIQWLGYALYPIMGWAVIAAAPVLVDHLSPLQLALVVGGGLAYTVGFPVLLLRRPDPWPKSFGYHEVWHGFTVLAAAMHFAAVAAITG